ncbi:Homeodomain protein [Pseudocohnilembus persalinus]|uniref:Homeodomain protein n=1 Tax=Pseudocohnilembus persalinus TaxID=266149 RepID=A0A0V0R7J4_PSEPJ|nr:Homeodomain protein [Pseudocohnilembus persalinus]|eukprot:KRX10455.1 Homeodomain protein [Pseudocohnilembus persalinus]
MFEQFVKKTEQIKPEELNLEQLKEFYQIKATKLQPVDQIKQNYYKIIQRQTYVKNQKKNWNDIETNILVWIIVVACSWQKLDARKIPDNIWDEIAQMMIGRTGEQCKFKWLSLSKMNLQQIPWTSDEDQILLNIIKHFQSNSKQNKWSEIARELNSQTKRNVYRAGKQCRERWNNHLDPSINRGPWSEKEDLELLKLILTKGKKWSDVSKSLRSSRTENSVKNRYNSLLKREKQVISQEKLEQDEINSDTHTSLSETTLIKSLIEKYENRIKNGLTLVNSEQALENINEEDDEEYEDNQNNQSNLDNNNDDDFEEEQIKNQNQNFNDNNNANNQDYSSQNKNEKVLRQKKKLMGLVENELTVKSEDYQNQYNQQQNYNNQQLFPNFIQDPQKMLNQSTNPQMMLLNNNQIPQNFMVKDQNQPFNSQYPQNVESPAFNFQNLSNISPQPFYHQFAGLVHNPNSTMGDQLEQEEVNMVNNSNNNNNNNNVNNVNNNNNNINNNNLQTTPSSQMRTPDSSKIMVQGNKFLGQVPDLYQVLQQNNSQNLQNGQNNQNQPNFNSVNNNQQITLNMKTTQDIKSEEEFNNLQLGFINQKTNEIFIAAPSFLQQLINQKVDQQLQIFQQQFLTQMNNIPNPQQAQQFNLPHSPMLYQPKQDPSPQLTGKSLSQMSTNYLNFQINNNSQFQNYMNQQTPPSQLQQRSFSMFQESPQLQQVGRFMNQQQQNQQQQNPQNQQNQQNQNLNNVKSQNKQNLQTQQQQPQQSQLTQQNLANQQQQQQQQIQHNQPNQQQQQSYSPYLSQQNHIQTQDNNAQINLFKMNMGLNKQDSQQPNNLNNSSIQISQNNPNQSNNNQNYFDQNNYYQNQIGLNNQQNNMQTQFDQSQQPQFSQQYLQQQQQNYIQQQQQQQNQHQQSISQMNQ